MAKNLFSALQKIASEASSPVTINEQGNKELLIAQETAKIGEVTDIAFKMYPNNPDKRFAYWKKNISLDGMSNDARMSYWKQYEQMHPRGLEGAKSDFVNVTLNEIGLTTGVSNKEFLLRDRITNSPPWAQKMLEPELAKYSTAVANANFSKANQVYGKTLQDKINRFVAQNNLDPDVSVDQHTSDFLRMEQLNLLDIASVVNGRVGAHNSKGEFIPGFALEDRKMVLPNDMYGTPSAAEQVIVRNTATKPIKDALETKIINQRSDISRQERATAMQATQMLENGDYTIDRWGEAFSINPESSPMDQVMRGLRGEIKTGRIKSEQDLMEGIYTAMVKYPSMFGDLNGTEQ